ncbi:Nedd8-like protein [Neofusicoccum parvum]|uniref:Nedd8-like protein n=1 Tax=Neofusicoccum parvum TaxID=310453 RepID=A0ACB5RTI1_9PEZI|nr:Nedd8-like protein [Neofusicoccum parvum]
MPTKLTFLRTLWLQFGAVYALTQSRPYPQARSEGIQWGPCTLNGSLPIECGNVSVPLDYSSSNSTKTLTLELLKVPALEKPSKGSVLINFGGPGNTGRETLAAGAAKLQAITGGHHDLVTFDPRGTGNTLPYSCYKNDTERLAANIVSQVAAGNSSDTMPGRLWALTEVLADSCQENNKEIGEVIGTAFVARDMMRIVDALGEDGLLRYIGYSYGSVLGATVASMFPDRMDRVILDGVVNLHEYYRGYEVEMFTDTDKTFAGFLSTCVTAGPEHCALARSNHTAASLEKAVYSLMDNLKYRPIPYQGIIIDYTFVRSFTLLSLYDPSGFPQLAALLDGLLTNNFTVFASLDGSTVQAASVTDGRHGIECSDKGRDVFASAAPAENGFDEKVLPTMEAINQKSRLAGDTSAYLVALCGQWNTEAKERYRGDFGAKTRHPVLLIGNTYDPVTPLVSARNVSEGLEGSVVLEHHGFGATQNYLVDGTLPEPGTVCEVDVPLFSNKTWRDILV